uniref:Uncharacterized protein n=1 Tax=Megaselia scalaris TaxID=36166 RepID=T1GN87_MEGSC
MIRLLSSVDPTLTPELMENATVSDTPPTNWDTIQSLNLILKFQIQRNHLLLLVN